MALLTAETELSTDDDGQVRDEAREAERLWGRMDITWITFVV